MLREHKNGKETVSVFGGVCLRACGGSGAAAAFIRRALRHGYVGGGSAAVSGVRRSLRHAEEAEDSLAKNVENACGAVRGVPTKKEGIVAYKGIRYATAGRFEYPTEVTKWDGVYDATEYGNCSYQPRAFYNEEEVVEKVTLRGY